MFGLTRCLLIALLCLLAAPAQALRFSVKITQPLVFIQIGSGELSRDGMPGGSPSQVDEVVFTFPASVQAGDGTPLQGLPVIPVAFMGYSGNNRANYSVTINSSAGLTNESGDRMPFSEFSWVTRDGDIPSGQFDDSANQLLQQYNFRGRRQRGVIDFLTFSYANARLYPAGTYTGRLVFTVTAL